MRRRLHRPRPHSITLKSTLASTVFITPNSHTLHFIPFITQLSHVIPILGVQRIRNDYRLGLKHHMERVASQCDSLILCILNQAEIFLLEESLQSSVCEIKTNISAVGSYVLESQREARESEQLLYHRHEETVGWPSCCLFAYSSLTSTNSYFHKWQFSFQKQISAVSPNIRHQHVSVSL